jgi:hypothetical protein
MKTHSSLVTETLKATRKGFFSIHPIFSKKTIANLQEYIRSIYNHESTQNHRKGTINNGPFTLNEFWPNLDYPDYPDVETNNFSSSY